MEKKRVLLNAAFFCFLLGLLLLPFDTFPYFRGLLREIGSVAPFYPFSLGIALSAVLFFLKKTSGDIIPARDTSFKLAGLFFVWVIISTLANWPDISVAVFKGRSGSVKCVLQVIMLAYCLVVALFAYRSDPGHREAGAGIDRFILLSFFIPAVFSILEILYLYKVSSGELLVYLRSFVSDNASLYERLRSVAGEPTSFAFYCGFLAPWLMRRVVVSEGRWLVLYSLIFAYFIFMVVLTLSRAAYAMALGGLAVFLILSFFRYGNRKRILLAAAWVFACFWISNLISPIVTVYEGAVVKRPVSTIFSGSLDLNTPAGGLSTRVRLSAQAATFGVANANPVLGVGFGQAGLHMHKFIPVWDIPWPAEVLNWWDDTPGSAWPPSHGLHARIAAETGYTGLVLWLGMWVALGVALLRRTLRRSGEDALWGAILCAGVSSCLLMGFNTDSFKFFEYWLVLGLGWAYLRPAANEG